MPQITVEYSAAVEDAFDRRAFALAFHSTAAELIGSDLNDYKSRFYRIDDGVIGDGSPGAAQVHVEVAILQGRSDAQKQELGSVALELLAAHLKEVDGLTVQATVELRALDRAAYHKRVIAG